MARGGVRGRGYEALEAHRYGRRRKGGSAGGGPPWIWDGRQSPEPQLLSLERERGAAFLAGAACACARGDALGDFFARAGGALAAAAAGAAARWLLRRAGRSAESVGLG